MKKVLIFALVLSLFLSAGTSLAANDNNKGKSGEHGKSGSSKVRTVEQKKSDEVVVLKQQIKAFQEERKSLLSELKSTLRQGLRNSDTSLLQKLLATDPLLYPEGLVTGYFGPLTTKAVKKFQEKHGLVSDGVVGRNTRLALEQKLEDDDLEIENDKEGKGRLCSIIPPGHLIAPGWLKHNGGNIPTIPTCQILPPGISKKLGLTPPPTADTTVPVISEVTSLDTNITATTAIVQFKTNEAAKPKVWFGTTDPLDLATASFVFDSTLATMHNITLTGLSPETTYYFIVGATDAAANSAVPSDQMSFTTAAGDADTTVPTISNINIIGLKKTEATVTWKTNEPGSSKVYYGVGTPVDTNTASSEAVAGLTINHSVVLAGLTQNTTYYYVVESQDLVGNKSLSTEASFTTTNI